MSQPDRQVDKPMRRIAIGNRIMVHAGRTHADACEGKHLDLGGCGPDNFAQRADINDTVKVRGIVDV